MHLGASTDIPSAKEASIVSTSNLGIAAGAALGSTTVDAAGIQPVSWAAAIAIAAALLIVVLARRAFPPTP